MLLSPTQQAFITLSLHAKIHNQLDGMEERYRNLLWRIDTAEVAAVDDDATYEALEALKRELLGIRFAQ